MRRIKKKTEIMRRGLKRNLEKVRRRLGMKSYHLSLTSIVFIFCIVLNFILFPIMPILCE